MSGDVVFETERLIICRFESSVDDPDCSAIISILNSDGWRCHLGEMGINTVEQARSYLRGRVEKMYAEDGMGMLAIVRRCDKKIIGCTGLIKRAELAYEPDLGFALIDGESGYGFATEAARGVLLWAKEFHGLRSLVAVTSELNAPARKLLARLGFVETPERPMIWNSPQVISRMEL